MIKIKWIKVGDVIEVDGKKAKLKSIGEDFRYATLYTFKREDGSKFYWWHREVYEYVMDRHIRKLENLLSDEKQRADELEKRWSELKSFVVDKAHFYENKGYMHQGAILVDVVEEMEQLEKEDDNA